MPSPRGATTTLESSAETLFILHPAATADVTALGTVPAAEGDGGEMPAAFLGKAAPRDWIISVRRASGSPTSIAAGATLYARFEDNWFGIHTFDDAIAITTTLGWARPLVNVGFADEYKLVGTLNTGAVIVEMRPQISLGER